MNPTWSAILIVAVTVVGVIVSYCVGLVAGQSRHHCIGCRQRRVEACGDLCRTCLNEAKAMEERMRAIYDVERDC